MKIRLVLFLSLSLALPLLAQDAPLETMENADFSDGTNHWRGDCKPAGANDSTDLLTGSSGNAAGIAINLRSHNWTTVTQEIHDYKGNWQAGAVLTITYQTSPDFKLSGDSRLGDGDDDRTPGLKQISASYRNGQIIAYVDVPPVARATNGGTVYNSGGPEMEIDIHPDAIAAAGIKPTAGSQAQTFTAQLRLPPPTTDNNPTFCLAIPPGAGSVTITKISIVAR